MQSIANSKNTWILVLGDILAYVFSLILTLSIRYGEIPTRNLLGAHVLPFAILIIIFLIVNFSAGLYEKQIIRARVPWFLFNVQIVNAVIGIIFFYLAPIAIAPKANLLIYFIISTALLFVWRWIMFPVMSSAKPQAAVLIGSGADVDDIFEEVNRSSGRYGIFFKEYVAPKSNVEQTVSAVKEAIKSKESTIVVADFRNSIVEQSMPFLYSLVFSGTQIVDASKLYESVFDRVPLSMLGERWFVENSSTALGNRRIYDGLKRLLDVIVSALGGLLSLVFYPFVYLAIKADDGGPIFIRQNRVGQNGKSVQIIKFRSMTGNDSGKYENGRTKNVVTKVGKFLRKSRLDELPQFWNVLRGDLAMVGPRPELPDLVSIYETEIPYYNARHLVKPGLFGWAQIYHQAHPHHAVATEDTRDKLSYDLYYIKNRSLLLDVKITLRTMQIIFQRVGK